MARRPSSVCPSVRPSVNFFAQIASTTTQMARLRPNLHTMISRRARIQGVLKVEVTVQSQKSATVLSHKSETVAEFGDSLTFLRQPHFRATVWTGLMIAQKLLLLPR